MRLRATVREVTGNTKHHLGALDDQGNPIPVERLPTPAWVEIHEEVEGYFLVHCDSMGEQIADTWHRTLTEAMHQAEFEFRITEADWVDVD